MNDDKIGRAIEAIDRANAEDPNREIFEGMEYPKESLYSRRMTDWLERLDPAPSAARRIAARAQHIRRWTVPREEYPEGREGYLKWRSFLYRFHAEQVGDILRDIGYEDEFVAQVKRMVGKQGVKRDPDVQLLEDVACLVFLEYYFPEFAAKYEEDKLIDILRKTWKKMSEQGHAAALQIPLPEDLQALVGKALA
jgi:hypothetical protein